jgi:hypothetical protein
MVIIGMMSYPTEAANEIGKRFLGLKALPTHITMKGPYISSLKGEGIQTLTVYECEKSKLADTYELIGSRYATFFGVPGFTYSIQAWFDVGEALKMIGLA